MIENPSKFEFAIHDCIPHLQGLIIKRPEIHLRMRDDTVILYGSYGYTGKLIAAACKLKKLDIILAGRRHEALQKQHDETGYPFEVMDIANATLLRDLLLKGSLVIHCGGPFQYTAQAMVEACLETKTHYTDITGEYPVFELLSKYDEKAKSAGITILPGTGFDVVPSDCLALHLKNRLPSATHLQLAFAMSKGGLSRGTTKTSIEGLGYGSTIRHDGRLMAIPLGAKVLEVDFGPFKTESLNIPWGDISTAWRSTGIPNIEVYIGMSKRVIRLAGLSKHIGWLLRQRFVKNYLLGMIENRSPGPSDEIRTAGKSYLWGRVWNEAGEEAIATLVTPNGYTLTANASVLIAEKILSGNYKPGYQTPAMCYGADLILELGDSTRVDR